MSSDEQQSHTSESCVKRATSGAAAAGLGPGRADAGLVQAHGHATASAAQAGASGLHPPRASPGVGGAGPGFGPLFPGFPPQGPMAGHHPGVWLRCAREALPMAKRALQASNAAAHLPPSPCLYALTSLRTHPTLHCVTV